MVHVTIDQRHGTAPFIRLAVDGSPELMPTEARGLAARLIEQAEQAEALWREWDDAQRTAYIERLKAKVQHG